MASHFDAIIVGAGIAGSACARLLARGGRSVALVDRRPQDRAGARWVNGVPADTFEEADLPAPTGEELRGSNRPFTVASPSGRSRVHLSVQPVHEVDMRLLGARLREEARLAGATIYDSTAVQQILLEGQRPVGLATSIGELHAPVVIDASGLPAIVRREVFPHWPALGSDHLCLAAQAVHRIDDEQGAQAFLERLNLRDGETLALTGKSGGYSVLSVRAELDRREVSILTGSIHRHPDATSGTAMMESFLRDEPWVGPRLFGGSGAVPVRRPYSRLVAPGLALLGDSGCQVFPAHGSGIAIGLRAARVLAQVMLAVAPARAGDQEVLWRYASIFHRTWGGLLAAYDVMRRFTQSLTSEENELIFRRGLASPHMVAAALAQRLPPVSLSETVSSLKRAIHAPRLSMRMCTTLSRIPLCVALAQAYPLRPDLGELKRFESHMARLLRESPDPVY